MTCPHCNAILPVASNKSYQTVNCHRCGAGFIVSVQQVKPPAVLPEEIKNLRIGNS